MFGKNVVCLLFTVFLHTVAEAQQPGKVPRIGYLSSVDPATDSPRANGLRRALRDLGYIEGQNITFEFRHGEGKRDRAPEFVAELVRVKVDIILITDAIIQLFHHTMRQGADLLSERLVGHGDQLA